MKKKYQNAFFAFGIAVLAVMVSQLDFAQVWAGLRRAGYWFFAVLALWLFLYMLNTSAWLIIIAGTGRAGKDGPMRRPREINFWWLYKITVSGFALNYTTPCGLMGGEPYRVMALAPRIGAERASASVILYAMTHIFSHLWFWLLSCALYALTQPVNVPAGVMLAAVASLCCVAIWFFIKGYKKGIAVRCMSLLRRFPGLKRRAGAFIERHKEQLDTIDSQIAALHNQNPRAFVSAVALELACRVASALEIFLLSGVRADAGLHVALRQHAVLHAAAARRPRGRLPHVGQGPRPHGQRRNTRRPDRPRPRARLDRRRPAAHQARQEAAAITAHGAFPPRGQRHGKRVIQDSNRIRQNFRQEVLPLFKTS